MALSAKLQQTYRERLEQERANVQSEIENLGDEVAILGEDQQVEGSFGNHDADNATDVMEQQRNMAMMNMLEERQRDIERALVRLDEGKYGICERCGKAIAPERLEALPFVTLCIDDQEIEDQQRRPNTQ
jgi:DnaK suppressor protein